MKRERGEEKNAKLIITAKAVSVRIMGKSIICLPMEIFRFLGLFCFLRRKITLLHGNLLLPRDQIVVPHGNIVCPRWQHIAQRIYNNIKELFHTGHPLQVSLPGRFYVGHSLVLDKLFIVLVPHTPRTN